ncbi:hypothetical protein Pint_36721 [Pistacia integerrima]|nr:hypothetical protein Pint_36721 [Pistacia integerrima]
MTIVFQLAVFCINCYFINITH